MGRSLSNQPVQMPPRNNDGGMNAKSLMAISGSSVLELLLLAGSLLACLCSQDRIEPLAQPEYAAVDLSPAWSPDGSFVAYSRSHPSAAGPPGIYITRSDGTGNRLLLEARGGRLRFSPDGSLIAMALSGDIFLFDLRSGDLRQLTATEENEVSVDWSPDAQSLVTSGVFVSDQGLRIVDATSGSVRAITHGLAHVYGDYPRWSPAGGWVAFAASSNDGKRDIFTITPDGTVLNRLTDSAGRDGHADDPRWLYGGTHILYSWHQNNSSNSTRLMRADGSGDSPWPVRVHYWDAISPDSRYVITIAAQPGDERLFDLPVGVLFVRELDDASGATMRQLTSYSAVVAPDLNQ
jgi:dipeptidyl aminopeptidase/acylaminoacyl peptidase